MWSGDPTSALKRQLEKKVNGIGLKREAEATFSAGEAIPWFAELVNLGMFRRASRSRDWHRRAETIGEPHPVCFRTLPPLSPRPLVGRCYQNTQIFYQSSDIVSSSSLIEPRSTGRLHSRNKRPQVRAVTENSLSIDLLSHHRLFEGSHARSSWEPSQLLQLLRAPPSS